MNNYMIIYTFRKFNTLDEEGIAIVKADNESDAECEFYMKFEPKLRCMVTIKEITNLELEFRDGIIWVC